MVGPALADLLCGVALLAFLSGCAAGPAEGEGRGKLPAAALDPSPVTESDKALTGTSGRCKDGVCACRPIDDYGRGDRKTDVEDPPPAVGMKRYELRTGRGNDEYRITVEGVGTFRKSGEDPEPACIYVDLPPGPQRVRYHVVARSPAAGLEARLRVSEYSARYRRWYQTFAYRCGSGSGPCTKDDARDGLKAPPGVEAGKYDRCGSTRVQGLRFFTDQPGTRRSPTSTCNWC